MSFVPNRLTTKSLAPGGWWSMMPLADRRDERGRPGQEAGHQLRDAKGRGDATIPATPARPAGTGAAGSSAAGAAPAGPGSDRGSVVAGDDRRGPCGAGVSNPRRSARSVPAIARPRAAARRPRTGLVPQDLASIGPAATARPVAQDERVAEPRRDLLDVVRDEHDRRRPRSAARRPRSRSSVSRAARSRLAVGSSRRSRSGSGMSARAIEVRRRSPAESVPNGWSTRRPGRCRAGQRAGRAPGRRPS